MSVPRYGKVEVKSHGLESATRDKGERAQFEVAEGYQHLATSRQL